LVSKLALIVFQKNLKMVGQNQTFAGGASINRPPFFVGEIIPFA